MNSGTSTNPHYVADCLRAADYRRLADFIHASSGIKMPSSKKNVAGNRASPEVRVGPNGDKAHKSNLFDQLVRDTE